jgi:hypothetical protein
LFVADHIVIDFATQTDDINPAKARPFSDPGFAQESPFHRTLRVSLIFWRHR